MIKKRWENKKNILPLIVPLLCTVVVKLLWQDFAILGACLAILYCYINFRLYLEILAPHFMSNYKSGLSPLILMFIKISIFALFMALLFETTDSVRMAAVVGTILFLIALAVRGVFVESIG